MIDFKQEELLEAGEVMIQKVRKHWIVYVEDVFLHAFGCLIFIVFAYYLASRGSFGEIGNTIETSYGAMILIMFVLIFWTSFFYAWTKDYFDVWDITNKHIIAINQKGLINREESFMELTRIQDVQFEKNGIVSTMLGYGRLTVQSAGTEQEFIMEDVAQVEAVARRIMDIRDEVQGKNRAQNTDDRTQTGI